MKTTEDIKAVIIAKPIGWWRRWKHDRSFRLFWIGILMLIFFMLLLLQQLRSRLSREPPPHHHAVHYATPLPTLGEGS